MCPPLCSAGLAAFVNFVLLVYALAQPNWTVATTAVFVLPFGAAITLLFFYWNKRISFYAGWVLVISAVLKLAAGITFAVAAGQSGEQDGFFAAIGVLVFTIFAIGSGLSAFVDGWAGWSYAQPCSGRSRGSRLVDDQELGAV